VLCCQKVCSIYKIAKGNLGISLIITSAWKSSQLSVGEKENGRSPNHREKFNKLSSPEYSGKTLAQLKKEIQLPQYSHLKKYNEWLAMNVEGVYERLMEESGMGWRPDIE